MGRIGLLQAHDGLLNSTSESNPIQLSRLINTSFMFSLAILVIAQDVGAGFVSDWEASSGLLPNQIAPPYSLSSNGNAMASLGGGALTISTVLDASQFYYEQDGPTVDTSKAFYMETRLKLDSGDSSVSFRGPATFGFTSSSGVGNDLWFQQGKVFFNTAQGVAGPTAFVDTTSAFHTYRMNYDGNGGITLLYDGSLILTTTTYASIADHGSTQRIIWGDASLYASGVSEWQYFTHNALTAPAPVPEPSSYLLIGIGLMTVASCRRLKSSLA